MKSEDSMRVLIVARHPVRLRVAAVPGLREHLDMTVAYCSLEGAKEKHGPDYDARSRGVCPRSTAPLGGRAEPIPETEHARGVRARKHGAVVDDPAPALRRDDLADWLPLGLVDCDGFGQLRRCRSC